MFLSCPFLLHLPRGAQPGPALPHPLTLHGLLRHILPHITSPFPAQGEVISVIYCTDSSSPALSGGTFTTFKDSSGCQDHRKHGRISRPSLPQLSGTPYGCTPPEHQQRLPLPGAAALPSSTEQENPSLPCLAGIFSKSHPLEQLSLSILFKLLKRWSAECLEYLRGRGKTKSGQ